MLFYPISGLENQETDVESMRIQYLQLKQFLFQNSNYVVPNTIFSFYSFSGKDIVVPNSGFDTNIQSFFCLLTVCRERKEKRRYLVNFGFVIMMDLGKGKLILHQVKKSCNVSLALLRTWYLLFIYVFIDKYVCNRIYFNIFYPKEEHKCSNKEDRLESIFMKK